MNDSYWNKCDICGKFIPFLDFDNGKAIRRMTAPDSHLSREEWETLCRDHYKPVEKEKSA